MQEALAWKVGNVDGEADGNEYVVGRKGKVKAREAVGLVLCFFFFCFSLWGFVGLVVLAIWCTARLMSAIKLERKNEKRWNAELAE